MSFISVIIPEHLFYQKWLCRVAATKCSSSTVGRGFRNDHSECGWFMIAEIRKMPFDSLRRTR